MLYVFYHKKKIPQYCGAKFKTLAFGRILYGYIGLPSLGKHKVNYTLLHSH